MSRIFSVKRAISSSLVLVFLLVAYAQADTEIGKVGLWTAAGTSGFVRVYNVNAPAAGSGIGTARCTGGYIGGMTLSLTDDYGRGVFSQLLAAQAMGKSITFNYTYTPSNNMCSLDGLQVQ